MALTDSFGRRIDYLRVSVTDRCDLRCSYCLPKGFKGFDDPDHWLSHDEMARLVGLFVQLGISQVRLTGGEPLLRRGVTQLARQIASLSGLRDLSLSSNGTQLAHQARPLYEAGVRRLNISLDTLDRACFARITGRDALPDVLAGLRQAQALGFSPLKLNMVVQADVNVHEVGDMLAFAAEHGFILRLIEPMPMGPTGQAASGVNLTALGATWAQRLGLVPQMHGGLPARQSPAGAGPARYWCDRKGRSLLGVITPLSRHFCDACNRVRLSADGTLHLCLGQNDRVPLGQLLRSGADDATLLQAIRDGIAVKPWKHDFNDKPYHVVRFMSQTGG